MYDSLLSHAKPFLRRSKKRIRPPLLTLGLLDPQLGRSKTSTRSFACFAGSFGEFLREWICARLSNSPKAFLGSRLLSLTHPALPYRAGARLSRVLGQRRSPNNLGLTTTNGVAYLNVQCTVALRASQERGNCNLPKRFTSQRETRLLPVDFVWRRVFVLRPQGGCRLGYRTKSAG